MKLEIDDNLKDVLRILIGAAAVTLMVILGGCSTIHGLTEGARKDFHRLTQPTDSGTAFVSEK